MILVKIDDDKCHGAKLVAIGRVRLVNLIRVNALVSGARKMSTMREDPMLALARPLETRGKTVFMPGPGNPPGDFSPFFDASLLFRHMERLRIDRDQLASDDPLLFRELKGRCALCRSKEQCLREDAVDQNKIGRETGTSIARMPEHSTPSEPCRIAAAPPSI